MLDASVGPDQISFDPQGHRMGPVGTLACQAALVLSLIWAFGAVASLFLPPTIGLLPLLLALGAVVLAPKSVVMRLPVSLTVLTIIGLSIASIAWTIDGLATSVVLRQLMPAAISMAIVAGLLPLRDFMNAFLWAIRITVAITVVALAVMPETRVHIIEDQDNYAGWHGLFLHKNKMAPFFVIGVGTILTFDRSYLMKWGTLGVMGVLFLGSTSATGISAAFLIVVTWVWLRIYQSTEDLRTSTVFFSASVLGFLGIVGGTVASLATITSAYGKELTFSGRTFIWAASISAIQEKPLLGYGVGALFWQEPVGPETARFWREVGFEAAHGHNGALDLALQVGLVGLAVFAVLWVSVFRQGWGALSKEPALGVWVVSILIAQMFMSLSEDVYFGGWVALLVAMKVLLARRRESLHAPGLGQMTRWA